MNKEIVTSQLLMDDASTYYTNMVASGDWKSEVNKHAQIIVLTTQITELKKEFNEVKAAKNITPSTPTPSRSGSNKFKQWRLEKVDNKEEFNMVLRDGKTYYWCDKHNFPSSNFQGMYIFHKPTEHDTWQERKSALNGRRGKKGEKEKTTTPASTPAYTPAPKPSSTPSAAKLSLVKSLQEALATTTSLTNNQFTKIWDKCCSASGN